MQRDLVLRARSGDHDAFTALATASFDRLHRTARLILRSDDRAADAVQESLVAAWLHMRSVRDPDRFDAWLHRLLVHACYREARRVRRREVVEIQVPVPDARAGGDAQALTAMRDQLERGFRRLTPEQRAVLVVHHYLGLPDAEAAIILDIAVGTTRQRRADRGGDDECSEMRGSFRLHHRRLRSHARLVQQEMVPGPASHRRRPGPLRPGLRRRRLTSTAISMPSSTRAMKTATTALEIPP